MNRARRFGIAAAAVALSLLSGCYKYIPAEVHAFHAYTGQPLQGVRFRPSHPRWMEFFPPRMEPAATDSDGVAHLELCRNYESGTQIFLDDDRYIQVMPDASPVFEASGRNALANRLSHGPLVIETKLLPKSEYYARRRGFTTRPATMPSAVAE